MRSPFYTTLRDSSRLSPLAQRFAARYLREKRRDQQATEARCSRLEKAGCAEVARQLMLAETPSEIALVEDMHADEIAAWSTP